MADMIGVLMNTRDHVRDGDETVARLGLDRAVRDGDGAVDEVGRELGFELGFGAVCGRWTSVRAVPRHSPCEAGYGRRGKVKRELDTRYDDKSD